MAGQQATLPNPSGQISVGNQVDAANGKLAVIKIADIIENPDALRSVNRSGEGYLGLVDSIRLVGVQQPIQVREVPDRNDPSKTVYGLIDGLHRYTAAQDAGLTEIPVYITSKDDAEVLEAQIMANVHRIETKPAEYSQALLRLLGQNPTMTINELAKKLAKSPKWLSDRLSITKLHEKIQALVDEGRVNLTNAYALAKLKDVNEQLNFLDRAMTENPAVFVPLITNRVKEINDERRKGREAAPESFVPIAHLRKLKEIEEELNSGTTAQTLKGSGRVTNSDDFRAGVEWAVHLDAESIEQARQSWENKKKEREENKKKSAIEKNQKKLAEAQKVLAEIQSGANGEEPVVTG